MRKYLFSRKYVKDRSSVSISYLWKNWSCVIFAITELFWWFRENEIFSKFRQKRRNFACLRNWRKTVSLQNLAGPNNTWHCLFSNAAELSSELFLPHWPEECLEVLAAVPHIGPHQRTVQCCGHRARLFAFKRLQGATKIALYLIQAESARRQTRHRPHRFLRLTKKWKGILVLFYLDLA